MNRESPTAAQDARIARLFQSMIESAASCDSDATAAAAIVRQIADFCGCPRVHLVSGRQGRWVTLAAIGDGEPPPTTLLANAADSEEPEQLGSWVAVALPKPQRQSEVLAVDWHAEHTVHIDWLKRWVVPATATTLRLVRDRQTNAREISKLNAMLTIAAMQPDRTDAPAILEHVGNSCLAILHAKQARMFLYQPTDDRFVAVASPAAAGDADANQPGPLDGFLAREVIRTRTTRQMDVVPRVLLVPFCSPNQRFVGVVEIVAEDSERFSEAAQADAIELVKLAGRVLEHAVADGQGRPPGTTQPTSTEWRMIGDSSAMSELRAKLQRAAPTDLAVLILGENGTGKEIAASQIHHWSHRADQPFVAVNCAAISEPLLESELFGHEKGAFTDAHQARQGKFELASGGTLFLDEIGDLSAGAGQAPPCARRESGDPRRRVRTNQHRHSRACCHEPRFGCHGSRRFVSRGFVFSPQRGDPGSTAATRSGRGHCLAGQAFPADVCRAGPTGSAGTCAIGGSCLAPAPLVRQRPRAAEPDGTPGLSYDG